MIVTKDYLKKTNLIIYQELSMYHFNSDTSLLGEFIEIGHHDSVLDIGCNNGALLLYASIHQPKKLVGVDIYEEVLDIAQMNMTTNKVNAELYCSKIQDFSYVQFDKIICNPPYFHSTNTKLMNENKYIRSARHEEFLPMDELFSSVNRLLKDNGRFYYVHRPFELNRIEESLIKNHLRIKKLQIYYDRNTEKARTICMEIVKGLTTEMSIEKPIYL